MKTNRTKVNENTKVTLTYGQLKKLVKESIEDGVESIEEAGALSESDFSTLTDLLDEFGDLEFNFGDYQSEWRGEEAQAKYDEISDFIKEHISDIDPIKYKQFMKLLTKYGNLSEQWGDIQNEGNREKSYKAYMKILDFVKVSFM